MNNLETYDVSVLIEYSKDDKIWKKYDTKSISSKWYNLPKLFLYTLSTSTYYQLPSTLVDLISRYVLPCKRIVHMSNMWYSVTARSFFGWKTSRHYKEYQRHNVYMSRNFAIERNLFDYNSRTMYLEDLDKAYSKYENVFFNSWTMMSLFYIHFNIMRKLLKTVPHVRLVSGINNKLREPRFPHPPPLFNQCDCLQTIFNNQ